jgi:hypothetical protein
MVFIADEVQSGFAARVTGSPASTRGRARPDHHRQGHRGRLPLAAVTGRAELMDAVHGGGLGGTYGGNPVACAAALGAIEEMKSHDLNARARAIESLIRRRLEALQVEHPVIAEIRGRGAMMAIELCKPGTLEPDAARTAEINKRCHAAGVVTLTCGTWGNVRSRNGFGASNASGPRHAGAGPCPAGGEQLERDDRVERGLPDDALAPYSAIVHSLSTHVVQVHLTGLPSLPVPVTQRPAQVLPVIRGPRVGGVGQTGCHDVARGDTGGRAHLDRLVLSRPSLCSVFRIPMNSSPNPYLNVTRLASTQRGMSSTSSCSTLTHSTGPMPSGKSKTSGSLNGGVVYQPRSFSQITGGLRHSSIVVQIENSARSRARFVAHHEVGAVAGAQLVDLAEQVIGGVAREHVAEPGLDAHPHTAPGDPAVSHSVGH